MAGQLKTCDPGLKQKFEQAGCHLDDAQEHQLAEAIAANPQLAGFDWTTLLGLVGKLFPGAANIINIILALLPKQAQAQAQGQGQQAAQPAAGAKP